MVSLWALRLLRLVFLVPRGPLDLAGSSLAAPCVFGCLSQSSEGLGPLLVSRGSLGPGGSPLLVFLVSLSLSLFFSRRPLCSWFHGPELR